MRIVNAELPALTAEEIPSVVRMAYEAGRTRGREETTRDLQGLEEPPYAREECDWTEERIEWPIGHA